MRLIFFLSKSSIDWNAVFIEIEKPHSRFFKETGNDFHPDFVQALQQINKWRAWLKLEPSNLQQFSESTIKGIKKPLSDNPVFPKFVLVFGRREEIQSTMRRKLVKGQETEDFKIITYDSLLEAPEQHQELYLGVRKNEYFELYGDKALLNGSIFEYMAPDELRIKQILKEDFIKQFEKRIEDQLKDRILGSFLHVEQCNYWRKSKVFKR
ncbi:Shedu anti-phage system protein SduA domain-containing protein [Chitinophaga caseinilytica]|uniref:Shedu anti-phage system protein SduA domain-containing protein n=1 Tax=Chitinophaga caseinilytica TaxID=2267521 RepID=A0ABZ2ZBM0_9BACT